MRKTEKRLQALSDATDDLIRRVGELERMSKSLDGRVGLLESRIELLRAWAMKKIEK